MLRKTLLLSLLCILLFPAFLSAQGPMDLQARTQLDTRFWPFYHGVASGDPMSDRIIIWTRLSPIQTGTHSVNWAMATDTSFSNVVQSGTASTHDTLDFTVKVDVTGLQPATWYYYRFENGGRYSITGRTYTAPVGQVDSLRFGVVSCSNYGSGWFNAYGALALRNDVHAVLHLGDYIYEGSGGDPGREHEPDAEIVDLEDYRMRHSQYKLDEDLRCLHQLYPFVTVWDDHESANDSYKDGAENHQPADEGPWNVRKYNAIRAYKEWMPIRDPDPNEFERIYRTLHYGELLDLIMLDTRLIGRDEQVFGAAIDDPARNLLGPNQLSWLAQELDNSTAEWKILGQQVMMAPLEIPFVGPVNTDQWDGYRAERQRVYDSILTRGLSNIVVLTGDIHSAWANDLPLANYDENTGANAVGVEFVTTSVTSTNSIVNQGGQLIQAANPHMKYINLSEHGYFILDVQKARTQADFWYVNDIDNQGVYTGYHEESWFTQDGGNHLEESVSVAAPGSTLGAVVPNKFPPNDTLVALDPDQAAGTVALLGAYPTPFVDHLSLKYYLHRPGQRVRIQLLSMQGQVVADHDLGKQAPGLHFFQVPGSQLAQGAYLLRLEVDGMEITRTVARAR